MRDSSVVRIVSPAVSLAGSVRSGGDVYELLINALIPSKPAPDDVSESDMIDQIQVSQYSNECGRNRRLIRS